MSSKLKLTLKNGQSIEVEGQRFSHYVQNCRYWFFLHTPIGQKFGLQITHCDSGMRVCEVEHITRQACLGDDKAAAKMSLDKLCQRVGEAQVASALRAAEAPKTPEAKQDTSGNRARFETVLIDQYRQLFETPEFALAKARFTPESLAAKMTAGLIDGTASNDGDGIKRTCKVLGIKPTYKAIREFLAA